MSRRLTFTLLLLLAAGAIFTLPFLHAEAPVKTVATVAPSANATNLLTPGNDDGQIAYVAARALEQNHFRRHSLDDDYSEQFFDRSKLDRSSDNTRDFPQLRGPEMATKWSWRIRLRSFSISATRDIQQLFDSSFQNRCCFARFLP